RAVRNTAVEEDQILTRNPCRVVGADRGRAARRPVVTVGQVFELADRMPDRFRVLVLLGAFCSLRRGEETALRSCDVAEDASTVQITRAFVEVYKQGLIVGPPKSEAGLRNLTVPTAI